MITVRTIVLLDWLGKVHSVAEDVGQMNQVMNAEVCCECGRGGPRTFSYARTLEDKTARVFTEVRK